MKPTLILSLFILLRLFAACKTEYKLAPLSMYRYKTVTLITSHHRCCLAPQLMSKKVTYQY